jgi:hypothetical protein
MRRYKIVIYVSELMNWVSFSIRQPQIVKGERKFAKVIIMHKLQTIVQYKLLKGENFQFREQRRRMVTVFCFGNYSNGFFFCWTTNGASVVLFAEPAHGMEWVMRCRTEPVFLNVYGAQESVPRHQFRQPM